MNKAKSDRFYLLHVRDACDLILEFTRKGEDAFYDDVQCQHAVIRDFQVIGEAVKNVSDQVQRDHPDIPWREIAGMRDRMVHGYFEIDLDIVWGAVVQHIPRLRRNISTILETMDEPEP